MTNPQKAKGSSFERDIARFLTDTYGETFIRAPGSGAYVGGLNSHRREFLHEGQIRSFKGDIVPGSSFGAMNVECKSYKDFPFHLCIQGTNKILDEWIGQMLTVADQGDFNILFMKFNRKGTFVAVESRHNWDSSISHIQYHSPKFNAWHIFEIDQFFSKNKDKVAQLSKSNKV